MQTHGTSKSPARAIGLLSIATALALVAPGVTADGIVPAPHLRAPVDVPGTPAVPLGPVGGLVKEPIAKQYAATAQAIGGAVHLLAGTAQQPPVGFPLAIDPCGVVPSISLCSGYVPPISPGLAECTVLGGPPMSPSCWSINADFANWFLPNDPSCQNGEDVIAAPSTFTSEYDPVTAEPGASVTSYTLGYTILDAAGNAHSTSSVTFTRTFQGPWQTSAALPGPTDLLGLSSAACYLLEFTGSDGVRAWNPVPGWQGSGWVVYKP